MTVLIIGNDDIHTQQVIAVIQEEGASCLLWDSRHYPYYQSLSVNPACQPSGRLTGYTPDGQSIDLSFQDIRSVYWYCFQGVMPPPPERVSPNQAHQYMHRWENMLYSTLELLATGFTEMVNGGPLWVNPPAAIRQHQWKAVQLQQVAARNVLIPPTLFSNDPEAILQFAQQLPERMVVKSPEGSGIPTTLQVNTLDLDQLDLYRFHPGQFQEFIEGTDIRIHVVGDKLFSTEIITTTGCYKTDAKMDIRMFEPPQAILKQSIDIARCLNYQLAGIDFRRTADNQYYFLEANPSPQFLIFDKQACSGQITKTLAQLLVQGK